MKLANTVLMSIKNNIHLCLSVVQTKERKPLMILFSEDAISCIHRAAVQSIAVVDEPHYLFLKKLSQACFIIYMLPIFAAVPFTSTYLC